MANLDAIINTEMSTLNVPMKQVLKKNFLIMYQRYHFELIAHLL